MLLNDFFFITAVSKGEMNEVQIKLNPDHAVYKGHFPGMPVAPGVCLLQMFKEVLEHVSETKLQLQKEANLKFTAVLNPDENPEVSLTFKYALDDAQSLKASGSLSANGVKFFSTKSTYLLK